MKTKHIIIYSVLLALLISVFAFCALNVDAAGETSGECGENLTWRYDIETLTLYIEGYGEMEDFFIDDVPWDGLEILNIVLPDGLTTIADSAFSYTKVRKVVIPDTVTIIGSDAFRSCHSLNTVEIGSSVTEICSEAFRDTGLKSVVIPGNVKTIGFFAFGGCGILESVTVCDGVEVIDDYAFNWCHRLKEVYIGNQVTTIGQRAFEACALNSVLIPESVTTVYMDSFQSCKNLETVTVESVEAINFFLKEGEGYLPWEIKTLILDGNALQQVPCINTDAIGVNTILGDKISYEFDSAAWANATSQHSYSTQYSMDSQYHWRECSDCGMRSRNVPHSYKQEVITPATYEKTGEGKYVCECGFHYFDIIPVLDPEESADFEHVIISPQPMPEQGDSSSAAQASPVLMLIIIGAVVGVLGTVLINAAIVVLIIVLVKKKKKNNKTSE